MRTCVCASCMSVCLCAIKSIVLCTGAAAEVAAVVCVTKDDCSMEKVNIIRGMSDPMFALGNFVRRSIID